MPSAKHYLEMDKAMGMILSLLKIASFRDMPFRQLRTYQGLTFTLLCVPVPFADYKRWLFAIA